MITLIVCIILFIFVFHRWNPKDKENIKFLNSKHDVISIKSYDNLNLNANVYHNDKSNDYVIFQHGYHCQYKNIDAIVERIYSLGYNVVVPWVRANMSSKGRYFTMGTKESKDFASWTKKIASLYPSSNIIIHGWSMGGAIIMGSLNYDLPEQVKGMIIDCAYFSLKGELEDLTKNFKPRFLMRYITYALDVYTRLFHKFSIKYNVEEPLKKGKLPCLFIHGKDDDFVLPHNTIESYNAYNGEKILSLYEGAKHIESFRKDEDRYNKEYLEFVTKCFKK